MEQEKGFSVWKGLLSLFVFAALLLLGGHTALSWVPVSLADVEVAESEEDREVVDLKQRLTKALADRYRVEISEAELNAYLNKHLSLRQSSIIDDYVTIKGVYVNVLPEKLEVTIERVFDFKKNVQEDGTKKITFLPFTQTVTLDVLVSNREDEQRNVYTAVELASGKFGQAPALGGMVLVTKPSFDAVARFFEEELKLAYNEKTSVKLEDGLLVVDARELAVQ